METTDEGRPAPKRARLPLALLGFLAIIAGVELRLARNDADFTNIAATDWRLTGISSAREARDAEILVFGDSLLKFGLSPQVIEARLQAKVHNLTVLGGQSASSYFLLRRALASGCRPHTVILDCQDPPTIRAKEDVGQGVKVHVRNWPELLAIDEAWELARSASSSTLFTTVALSKLMPSIKARDEIRTNLRNALNGLPNGSRNFSKIQRRNFATNQGSLLMPPVSPPPASPALAAMSSPPSDWVSDPVTTEYLRKFLDLATSRGIRVVWLIPPTSPEHQAFRSKVQQADYQTRQAAELRAAYPRLIVIDGREAGYPRRLFIDDTHLDSTGATIFSADLAESLARVLATGRGDALWTSLPAYRDRGAVPTVENLDGSRIALDAARKARR